MRKFLDIVNCRLDEDAKENRRILFHTTYATGLALILADNEIDTRTKDVASVVRGKKGISLTRSYEFARKFKGRRGITLVLDASHIRTVPVAYWTPDERKEFNRADEMEEFALQPITPLNRYLISINGDLSFEEFGERVSVMNTEYMPADTVSALNALIDNGFSSWKHYWNAWHPVIGTRTMADIRGDR